MWKCGQCALSSPTFCGCFLGEDWLAGPSNESGAGRIGVRGGRLNEPLLQEIKSKKQKKDIFKSQVPIMVFVGPVISARSRVFWV